MSKSTAKSAKSPFAGFSLASGKGPINIRSDGLAVDYKGKSVVFTGHVRAQQSGTVLECNRLTIDYTDQDFRHMKQMIADGDVRVTQGGRWATSNRAVMDQVKRTIVMTGDPVVHDGANQIAGDRITIFLDTGKSVVDGAHALIFPKRAESRDNGTGPAEGR